MNLEKDPGVYFNLAEEYLSLSDFATAASYYKFCYSLTKSPFVFKRLDACYLMLALVLYKSGEYSQSLNALNNFSRHKELPLMAVLCIHLSKFDECLYALDGILESQKNKELAELKCFVLCQMGNIRECNKIVCEYKIQSNSLKQKISDKSFEYLRTALLFYEKKKYEKAMELIEIAIELNNGNSAEMFLKKGEVLFDAGEFAKAAHEFMKIRNKFNVEKKIAECYYKLAIISCDDSLYKEAFDWLKILLDIDPKHQKGRLLFAHCLETIGYEKKALELYSDLAVIDKDKEASEWMSSYYYKQSIMCFLDQKFHVALEVVTKSIEFKKTSDGFLQKAKCLLYLHRIAEAIITLEKSLELESSNIEASTLLKSLLDPKKVNPSSNPSKKLTASELQPH